MTGTWPCWLARVGGLLCQRIKHIIAFYGYNEVENFLSHQSGDFFNRIGAEPPLPPLAKGDWDPWLPVDMAPARTRDCPGGGEAVGAERALTGVHCRRSQDAVCSGPPVSTESAAFSTSRLSQERIVCGREAGLEELPIGKAFTLIEPGPVVLVTTSDGRTDNVMTISWTMVLDFTAKFAITTGAWNPPTPRSPGRRSA